MAMLRRVSRLLLAQSSPILRPPSPPLFRHSISLLSTAVDVAPPLPSPHLDFLTTPTSELPSSPPDFLDTPSSSPLTLTPADAAATSPLPDSLAKSLQTQLDTMRSEIDALKTLVHSLMNGGAAASAVAARVSGKVQWPEWTAFLEHLKSLGFFKPEETLRGSKPGASLADDPASLKRAIYKFSQVHESIYKSLTENNIKTIAQYGRVDDDQRDLASLKRLRLHFGLDEEVKQDEVSGSSVIPPKLSDVTRLLFTTVTMSQEGSLPDDMKLSVDKLLSEIINLSKPERLQQDSHRLTKEEVRKPSGKPEAKSDLWECPRCHFKNLDSKHRCVECSRRRSQKTNPVTEEKDSDIETILDDEVEVKPSPNGRQIKKNSHEKDDPKILSDEDLESNDELNDSDEEHGDILDDILDSDDTEDEDEKTTLSSLFDRKTSSTRQRDDRNDRGRNRPYRSSRGRQNDEDEPRSRYGSRSYVDESEDEDLQSRKSYGRGASENSFRRTDRGNQNARRGGFRSDGVYNERQSNGRWKEGRGGERREQRENGYEERGSRSGGGGGGRGTRGRGRPRY